MYEISKSDWKKYREKIGSWQENYMERLLKEYVAFLQTDELAVSISPIINPLSNINDLQYYLLPPVNR